MVKRKGNYKAGPGRPKGTGKYPRKISVSLTLEQHAFLVEEFGGWTPGIRKLIDAEIKRKQDSLVNSTD